MEKERKKREIKTFRQGAKKENEKGVRMNNKGWKTKKTRQSVDNKSAAAWRTKINIARLWLQTSSKHQATKIVNTASECHAGWQACFHGLAAVASCIK